MRVLTCWQMDMTYREPPLAVFEKAASRWHGLQSNAVSDLVSHGYTVRAEFEQKRCEVELQQILEFLVRIRQSDPHLDLPDQSQLSSLWSLRRRHFGAVGAGPEYVGWPTPGADVYEQTCATGSRRWRGAFRARRELSDARMADKFVRLLLPSVVATLRCHIHWLAGVGSRDLGMASA
jgi:hypothetical protein